MTALRPVEKKIRGRPEIWLTLEEDLKQNVDQKSKPLLFRFNSI